MKKKILAVFLSLCMAMSLLPVTALAAENGTAVTADTTELKSGSYYVSNDIKLNHSLTIPEGETVNLDLRGQTLTLQQLLVNGSLTIYDSQSDGQITSTITDKNTGAIKVGTAGLLTLKSGTISSPGYGVYVFDGGKTIVNGGMITSFYAPLAGNNTAGDMNFEVNGGTLTASYGPAIYMPGQVSLKITDGTLNGGISLRMGQVDISGGTINAITDNIDPITGYYNYSGNAWLADALYVFNGTYTSENVSYGNSLNLNITGGTFNCMNDQGSAVAIYDLGKVAQNSQVNISGDAVLNSSVGDRGAYQVLSLADVEVTEPAEGYGKEEYVGKVSTTITGGTFSSEPDADYIATGYAATENDAGKYVVGPKDGGALEVKPSTDSGKTSATLEGYYQNADTDITEGEGGTGSEVSTTGVTVDLTSAEPATTTGTVELTVNADTANSLANNSANSLVVKSDVGTVSLDKDALGKLKDVTAPVVISIAATNDEGAAPTWEVTVKEGKEELFAETTDVGITITVPAPDGATNDNTKVYCIDNGGMEDMNAELKEGSLTWTTKHLSTFAAITLNDEEASWVVNGTPQTTGKGTLKEALEAVDADGGTITLYKDAKELTNANYTISKPVTITGTGTITATDPNIHAFTISDQSSLTLNGVKLKITGKNNYGIDVRYGATLTLNNAEIDVSGVSNATISASWGSTSKEPGKFILNNSKITATEIGGNFSNGGDWKLTNSSIEIEDCASNGFSCNSATLDNSTVSVSGAQLMGVTAKEITLENDSAVTVKECGTDLPKASKWATDDESYKHPVEIKKGGKVTIDSTSSMTLQNNVKGNNTVYFVESTMDNDGTLQANVRTKAPTGSFSVTVKNGNSVLDVATVASGETYTLPAALSDYGYNHFQGWNDGTTTYAGGTKVIISKNTTFTAVWSYIPPANPNYRIDIPAAEGGTVTADPAAAKAGATVTLTATPDEGYAVGTITVTDRFGDAVKVTENADGTYTFTMPNGQVTVKATFVETEEPAPAMPFTDVKEGDWFYDEVLYVYENGLMNGVGDNRFAPNSATTRGMLVTILYRLEGEPDVTGEAGFSDVGDTWYTDAVIWAAANDIVNGIGDNQFGPENTLTREQLVTMLYRYAQNKGYDVTASADLSGYPDAGQIQSWAQEAMTWAVAEGIVEGMDGNLNPAGSATRAQIATILMRFCEGVAK